MKPFKILSFLIAFAVFALAPPVRAGTFEKNKTEIRVYENAVAFNIPDVLELQTIEALVVVKFHDVDVSDIFVQRDHINYFNCESHGMKNEYPKIPVAKHLPFIRYLS